MSKNLVSEQILGDAIKSHLVRLVGTPHDNYWISVEKKKRELESGIPNWRLVYNAGAVPAGFEKAWTEIRSAYEDKYDVE